MTLGENIYRYRTEKNWSQGDLAEALDVSRQSISKWENNLAAPDLDKLIKLRTVFNVSLDELILGIAPTETPVKDEEKAEDAANSATTILQNMPTTRHVIGFALLLTGLFILAPYNKTIISVCGIVYVVYCVICFAILNVSSIANGLFLFLASFIILTWFIICGLHANKTE